VARGDSKTVGKITGLERQNGKRQLTDSAKSAVMKRGSREPPPVTSIIDRIL